MKQLIFRWVIIFFSFCSIVIGAAYDLHAENKQILILDSYHQGFRWSDQVLEGIRETFWENRQSPVFYIEHLDTKRFKNNAYLEKYQELLELKYKKTKFSAIIVSDDRAFQFMLTYHGKLFRDIPVVFCGVSGFKPEMIKDDPLFTGVIQHMDVKTAIDLAVTLHPDMRHLVFINDNSLTGRACQSEVRKSLEAYRDLTPIYLDGQNLSHDELLSSIKSIPPNSVILTSLWNIDKSGQHRPWHDMMRQIAKLSDSPIYGLDEVSLEFGLVGGIVHSAFLQGQKAAELSLRLLNGKEKPHEITPILINPNRYLFDYQQLKKWKIPEAQIPEGSTILGKPASFYQQIITYLWGLGLSVVLLIAGLIVSTRKNSKIRKLKNTAQKNETILRAVLDNVPDLIWLKDPEGFYIFGNKHFERFFGTCQENLIGKTDYDFIDKKQADFFLKNDRAAIQAGTIHINEEEIKYIDDGHREILKTTKTPVFSRNGKILGVLGIGHDITERKLKERVQLTLLDLFSLSSEHDVKKMLQKFLDETVCLTKSKFGFFHFTEDVYKSLSLQSSPENTLSHGGFGHREEGCSVAVSDAFNACVRNGKPFIYNDIDDGAQKKDFHQGHSPIVRELAVPVIRDKKVVAVLGVGNNPNEYDKNDIKIVSRLANQAWEIVQKKISEEELQKRETLHKQIIKTTMEGFCRLDNSGSFLEVNDSYCRIVGYRKDEILQMGIQDVEALKNSAELANHIQKVAKFRYDRFESKHRRKDGTIIDIEISVHYLGEGHGQFICFIRDISERKKQERDLKFQAHLLDQIQDHVIAFDLNGNIIYVNEARIKSLKRKKSELLGKHVSIFNSNPEKGVTPYQILNATLKSGRWQGETVLCRNDGTEIVVNARTKIIKDKSGKPVSMISIGTDITEQKKFSERLLQSQKLESIGSLASGIAHDFNNILFPIIGLSELLLEDIPEESPENESIREILLAGRRGADLVEQILTFSRQSEYKKLPVRIQKIMKEVLKLIRSTIPASIEIVYELQPDCGLVMADPIQIHQVGMNLITNAFHALENNQPGRITVELKESFLRKEDMPNSMLQSARYVHLSISDNGIGMSKSILKKIFEPYFTTKKSGKGTGLGLAVVYGIIKDHHGDIIVESEIGTGSTFHILLPVMEGRAVESKTDENLILPPGDESILIVDDEESVINIESQILKRLGYRLTACKDSTQALELFKIDPYSFDLVITDLSMPNLTGEHLITKILRIRHDIPIILCTGFRTLMNEKMAKAVGAKAFLTKPIRKAKLAVTIRNLLDGIKT